jgi:hypothetical protein
VETGTAWRAPTRRGACYFILPAISRVILLVFLLVSAAIDEENYFTFRWLWQWSSIGQGHQSGIRPHPPTFIFLNKYGPKSHFWLRGCSPGFPGIRGVSWYPSW